MENLQGGTLSLEHRYRVRRHRGRSAFVTRYESLQLPFERPVWVEVYDALAEASAEPRVFERIKVSAHRAHRIDAESVLRLLDYGELDRGVPFVVTERAEGPQLDRYLEEEGPLPLGDTVALARRVGTALEAAHDDGLTHGTLRTRWITLPGGRPENARVGHFQVGITLDELRRMDGAVLTPELVEAFPPETFDRDTIPPDELDDEHDPTDEFTVAADVWAMGIVVYEALVGFHPFFDEDEPSDASDGIVRLQNEQPRPLGDFGIESEISDAVQRALARDPEERWDGPAAFVEALARAREHQSPETADIGTGDTATPDRTEREPSSESRPPSEGSADGSRLDDLDRSEDIQPAGPASLLVSLAVILLVGSNVGWFFYYMNVQSDRREPKPPKQPTAAGAPDQIIVESRPPEAAVYTKGREKPLGRTPLVLPDELAHSTTLKLQLKKAGFVDQSVVLGRDSSERRVRIHLHEATKD